MSAQAPSAVVLIRPHSFTPNPETRLDNAFQSTATGKSVGEIARRARDEVTELASALESVGVTVHLFDDFAQNRPDSVFPNNWLSTHAEGRIGLFPMFAPSRREERRSDIVEALKQRYQVHTVTDYSSLETEGVFLEGTGAMVFDHEARIAYAARSHRTDPVALERFCAEFGYEPVMFDAVDEHDLPIYHTNVMLCIATDFVLVGAELIQPEEKRQEIRERLSESGRNVIELTLAQIKHFAGNAIELQGSTDCVLVLSRRAYESLTELQLAAIERSCTLVPVSVPTIELAGGSVRCMIAGIHLDQREPSLAQETVPSHNDMAGV